MKSSYEAEQRTVTLTAELFNTLVGLWPPLTLEITTVDRSFNARELHWITADPYSRYADAPSIEPNESPLHLAEGVYRIQHDPLSYFADVVASGRTYAHKHAEVFREVLEGPEAVVPEFGSPPSRWLPLGAAAAASQAFLLVTGIAAGPPGIALGLLAAGGTFIVTRLGGAAIRGAGDAAFLASKYHLTRLFGVPPDYDG